MVRIRLSASCRRSVPLVASLPTFNKPTLGCAPARKRLQLQPNAANCFNCSTDTFKLAPKSNINNGLLTVGNKVANAGDRKSTRLNSSHVRISYAVFCLKKKKIEEADEN